jgi:hypothetical protein
VPLPDADNNEPVFVQTVWWVGGIDSSEPVDNKHTDCGDFTGIYLNIEPSAQLKSYVGYLAADQHAK